MNAALTRLTDSVRKKKTAKCLTKAQAEAVVIKFASLCNTATILRRVMNAVDQQEPVTFLKRLFFIFPREFALVEASARCTLPASFSAGRHYKSRSKP